MDALLATQDHDVIWASAAAKGHDLVQGRDAPVGVLLFMAPVITEGPMDIWSLGPDL